MTSRPLCLIPFLMAAACSLLSCGSSNPNIGRVLLSVSVAPTTADAQTFPDGQVLFTATGSFSLPPTPALLPAGAPYSGQFVVNNPSNTTIATIVSTGPGTATVQCASGASGSVFVTASASANNGTAIIVTGSAQMTCP